MGAAAGDAKADTPHPRAPGRAARVGQAAAGFLGGSPRARGDKTKAPRWPPQGARNSSAALPAAGAYVRWGDPACTPRSWGRTHRERPLPPQLPPHPEPIMTLLQCPPILGVFLNMPLMPPP